MARTHRRCDNEPPFRNPPCESVCSFAWCRWRWRRSPRSRSRRRLNPPRRPRPRRRPGRRGRGRCGLLQRPPSRPRTSPRRCPWTRSRRCSRQSPTRRRGQRRVHARADPDLRSGGRFPPGGHCLVHVREERRGQLPVAAASSRCTLAPRTPCASGLPGISAASCFPRAGWSSRSSKSHPSRRTLFARRRPANSLPDSTANSVADALEVDEPTLDVGAHELHPHATADIEAG